MNRRWIGVLAAVAVVSAVTAWLVIGEGDEGDGEGSDGADLSTAAVERRDLVERETFDGSLGFADEQALASTRAGTITWIAPEGSTIRRGEPLYEVDERPVSLMFGGACVSGAVVGPRGPRRTPTAAQPAGDGIR
jgi:hypothetical protein